MRHFISSNENPFHFHLHNPRGNWTFGICEHAYCSGWWEEDLARYILILKMEIICLCLVGTGMCFWLRGKSNSIIKKAKTGCCSIRHHQTLTLLKIGYFPTCTGQTEIKEKMCQKTEDKCAVHPNNAVVGEFLTVPKTDCR